MSEELQNDNIQLDSGEDITNEGENIGADLSGLAPDSQEKDLNNQDSQIDEEAKQRELNQEAINKQFAKKTFKIKQAERRAEEAEKRNKELEEQLLSYKPAEVQEPDPLSDDYEQQLAAYRKSIQEKAQLEARQNIEAERQSREAAQEQMKQQEEMRQKALAFVEKAEKNGISQDELIIAGQAVEAHGLPVGLQQHLMSHSEGDLILKYLASNPATTIQLSTMDPYQAALTIESDIKAKAQLLKPKNSAAPPPPKQVGGTVVDSDKSRYNFSGGATFE